MLSTVKAFMATIVKAMGIWRKRCLSLIEEMDKEASEESDADVDSWKVGRGEAIFDGRTRATRGQMATGDREIEGGRWMPIVLR
mmetsp:Transcript_6684/g.14844  ORF Transcript_6684/g.14844 Transcript_6684/m.14844 type:complete len:84 (+) Transcript_6684:2-253(+)